jgi:hypothetical protein
VRQGAPQEAQGALRPPHETVAPASIEQNGGRGVRRRLITAIYRVIDWLRS